MIDNDEKVAFSKTNTHFKTGVQKPYPNYDQKGVFPSPRVVGAYSLINLPDST